VAQQARRYRKEGEGGQCRAEGWWRSNHAGGARIKARGPTSALWPSNTARSTALDVETAHQPLRQLLQQHPRRPLTSSAAALLHHTATMSIAL
jgi:hypothetical protein